ncbi:MAG TPA: hypothetical protein PKH24_06085 [Sedimentisphaerales bacterium]|jgi:chromosome segregation ATPase|nr:hypothetical protein [Sedimentisphaerales bacterium]HNU27808.1 hypothetical protein [Sedimentisphaerales bacterium]
MNVMMDHTARGTDDGKELGGWFSVLGPVSLVCSLLVFLAGCDKKAVEEAQQEAREAKTAVQQLKHNLGLAEKEIAGTKAELAAVRQSRDELQGKINQIIQERDTALEYAQKIQEALAARSSGQAGATAALQQQIAELNALVADQQKLIEELQKNAGAEPTEETPSVEPNEQ